MVYKVTFDYLLVIVSVYVDGEENEDQDFIIQKAKDEAKNHGLNVNGEEWDCEKIEEINI